MLGPGGIGEECKMMIGSNRNFARAKKRPPIGGRFALLYQARFSVRRTA